MTLAQTKRRGIIYVSQEIDMVKFSEIQTPHSSDPSLWDDTFDPRQFNSYPAYLMEADRANLERLIWDEQHQRNVWGFYTGTVGDRARQTFDEIFRRGRASVDR